jgi:hypothetical protein
MSEEVPCVLCDRGFDKSDLTLHHFLPKEEGGESKDTDLTCGQCHSMVHATYTNKTLAALYNTPEKLRNAPELAGYFKWVKKQPATRRTKNKPRKRKL